MLFKIRLRIGRKYHISSQNYCIYASTSASNWRKFGEILGDRNTTAYLNSKKKGRTGIKKNKLG